MGATSSVLGWGFLFVFVALVALFLYMSIYVVEQGTNMVTEKWGQFHAKLEPGFHFLVPIMMRSRQFTWRVNEVYLDRFNNAHLEVTQYKTDRIDLRESVMDFDLQSVITRDNVELQAHPLLIYKITDPVRICYEVYDLQIAVHKLVQTTLRSIIGDMGLDDTLASREEINRSLLNKIRNVSLNWGIEITRVELLEIIPSRSIQEAMHMQLGAERVRRAAIVEAEGQREKMKLEAEGDGQARISLSKGEQRVSVIRARAVGEAKKCVAQAEADALDTIAESLGVYKQADPSQYLIGKRYVDMLHNVVTRAVRRVVYFPYEIDVVGSASQVRDRY